MNIGICVKWTYICYYKMLNEINQWSGIMQIVLSCIWEVCFEVVNIFSIFGSVRHWNKIFIYLCCIIKIYLQHSVYPYRTCTAQTKFVIIFQQEFFPSFSLSLPLFQTPYEAATSNSLITRINGCKLMYGQLATNPFPLLSPFPTQKLVFWNIISECCLIKSSLVSSPPPLVGVTRRKMRRVISMCREKEGREERERRE